MKTINIYGEPVEGEEIEYKGEPPKNGIIIEDHEKVRHFIHKESIDKNFKRAPSRAGVSFDLLGCQSNGRPKMSQIWRGKRGIKRS